MWLLVHFVKNTPPFFFPKIAGRGGVLSEIVRSLIFRQKLLFFMFLRHLEPFSFTIPIYKTWKRHNHRFCEKMGDNISIFLSQRYRKWIWKSHVTKYWIWIRHRNYFPYKRLSDIKYLILSNFTSGHNLYLFFGILWQISKLISEITKPRRITCDTALKSWRSILFDEKVFSTWQKRGEVKNFWGG